MEVDLLSIGDAVARSGIDEMPDRAAIGIVAYIFDEREGLPAELAFDHQGRLGGKPIDRVGGRKKLVSIPLNPQPPVNSHDHGNCT